MGISEMTLIHKKDGPFRIRVYDSEKYLIKMFDDGVDTSATAEPKNVMMPSLSINKDNAFIRFPVNGYSIDDVGDLVEAISDMPELLKEIKKRE